MDFSSLNPSTSNPLNMAARKDDFQNVHRLLKKVNPNCVDNRGWTCLHEAAASDSYKSLILILKHPECRPLAETHEGHTALYLACRHQASLKTIKAILDSVEDIANYGSTESVTPLHIVSAQGRVEVIEMLIKYGAMIDVQDFDGDTPLHDAALDGKVNAVSALLCAGADAAIRNETDYIPFHLACLKGNLEIIQEMLPFVADINQVTAIGDTALMLATQSNNDEVVKFLLKNGADPHIQNRVGDMAIDIALNSGYYEVFDTLLPVTDKDKMSKDIVYLACKPHYFVFQSLESLLNYNLGPEFFNFDEPFHVTLEQIGGMRPVYSTNAPLNSFLNICQYIYLCSLESFKEMFYLFLMNGVGVNALHKDECPPLVYIHLCGHGMCFDEVLQMLIEHGCDVDYSTVASNEKIKYMLPDVFIAAISTDPETIPTMIPYSLQCEPDRLLRFGLTTGILERIPLNVQSRIFELVNCTSDNFSAQKLPYYVLPLKHLARSTVREALRKNGVKTTTQFLNSVDRLPIPTLLKNYLRYM